MRILTLSWLFWIILLLNQAALPGTGVIFAVSALALLCVFVWPASRPLCTGYFVACLTLGWALFQIDSRQLHPSEISVDLRLRVKVTSVPQTSDWGIRFNARVLSCESCAADFGPQSVQLSWYGSNSLVQAGEDWEFTVRLKPFRGLRNQGSFDRTQWALYKGTDARGYVRTKPSGLKLASPSKYSIVGVREKLAEGISSLPSADNRSALVQALVLGIKHDIDKDVWGLLRDTGTSHLVAISGLHISLLAAWAYLLFSRILPRVMSACARRIGWLRLVDSRSLAVMLSVLVASVYSFLAGFELPVQRALTMLAIWAFAVAYLRHLAPALGLAMAMIAVLSNNVLSVLSPGFWLSFGTVAVLFYLHRGRIQSHLDDESDVTVIHRSKRFLHQSGAAFKTHVLLGLVLLPMTAWFFQSGSLVAPVANLLAVPWVGIVVVPLSFMTTLLSVASASAADFLLGITQTSIDVLLSYLRWLSDFELSAVPMSVPSGAALIFSLLGMLLFFSPTGIGLKRYAMLLFLPLLLFNVKPPRVVGFDLHVLDVGQGLASLVFTENHTLLFDTGGKLSSSLSMVEAVVMPYLHAQGRRKIDYLVVSHSDEDHAFGIDDVLRRFPDIHVLVGGDVLSEHEIAGESCKAGKTWSLDTVRFSILSPAGGAIGSDNDRSCVLLIHLGASRALLTGDIERQAEQWLSSRINYVSAAAAEPFSVNLLVAPHHGSHTSSSTELLNAVNPAHVVFASGHRNRYGFPHADVQLRYKLVGARQYITGTLGSIVFSFGRKGLIEPPITWWQTRRRFWHGFVNPVCSELFSEHATVIQQLLLAQKGQSLCGK